MALASATVSLQKRFKKMDWDVISKNQSVPIDN